MVLEKMRSCSWKLEPGFWTYLWIRLLDPSCPNVVSRPQAPRSRHFLRFHNFIGFISFFEIPQFYWIYLTILEKMRSCLWKLELGFLTNGLISHLPKTLGPSRPILVFRPQTPNVRVLGYENFFMSSFTKFYIT